jgi:hypothetical protein
MSVWKTLAAKGDLTVEKSIAKELIETLVLMDAPLNRIAALIEQIVDEEEKKRFRRTIATTMGTLYTDLELPIGEQYPDLSRDEAG